MADDYREEEIIVPLRCPNCGGLNPPENKVCQLCGYRLAGAKPASPPGVQLDDNTGPLDAATVSPPAPPASSEPAAPAPPAAPPPSRTPSAPLTSGRGGAGLAARLGGGGAVQSPADWLGDLRRTMGGEAPAVEQQPL